MSAQDDETVLFLFMAFGILIVLLLILIAVGIQTWLLWKVARMVVEGKGVSMEKERSLGSNGEVSSGDDAGMQRRKNRVEETVREV
jgi:hypothetical protein